MRALLISLLVSGNVLAGAEAVPLPRAHAHNDYEHPRPLWDALERGFCSVEADVYLVDGQLLVAHERSGVKPERTLAALYLDPLRERVKQNAGRVYRDGPGFVLLVDVKSDATTTYAVLHDVLASFAPMLTTFRGNRTEEGAITVIVSGNRARDAMVAQPVRYAALDGRTGDLDANPSPALVPLVSDNWEKVFTWRWQGTMPDDQRKALRAWVDRAHAQLRKVRFWNTPDRPDAWGLLLDAGVDVIGTDDLAGLQRYLATRPTP